MCNPQQSGSAPAPMHYELRLHNTAAGTGYFGCVPAQDLTFKDLLDHLQACPLDEFAHKQVLEAIPGLPPADSMELRKRADGGDLLLRVLLAEAAWHFGDPAGTACSALDLDPSQLSALTPLISLKSAALSDQALHSQWIELFARNILEHQPLPDPRTVGLAWPIPIESVPAIMRGAAPSIVRLSQNPRQTVLHDHRRPSCEETADLAFSRLTECGLIADAEMRHMASLSPLALLRRWRLQVSVHSGRHHHTLTGIQTSYGRGLSVEVARASYLMEIVERRCAFASFDRDRVVGQARQSRVLRGSLEELRRDGLRTLDPNSLCLEVPYRSESLYWIEAVIREAGSVSPIWVPAQSVFLFCNLDESSLYSGLGSTGLAAGNTVEEARLAALLEVIERDSEAVSVFNPARCFRIVAEDPAIGELLAAYRQGGIDVMCQELDNPFAVPCYKCFVVGPQGQIARGTGAHLDGRKALLSAVTETPYPFPYGPPSAVGPPQWPVARFEQLPVYTTGDTVEDLALLERVLNQSGYCPIYVDLTREDLGFPVVRALVPGLQTMADFDRYSRVSPRLFANYLKVFRLCG